MSRHGEPASKGSGLTREQREFFIAGGGNAAMLRDGSSVADVVKVGQANLQKKLELRRDYEFGGGNAQSMKGLDISTIVNEGRKNASEAFKAGGGNAAMRKGNTREEVIEQGIRNLAKKREDREVGQLIHQVKHHAGGGDAASHGRSTISQGANNISRFDQSSGSRRLPPRQDVLLKAGGGWAKVDELVETGTSFSDAVIEVTKFGQDNFNRLNGGPRKPK